MWLKKTVLLIFCYSYLLYAVGTEVPYENFRDNLGFVRSNTKKFVKKRATKILFKILKGIPYIGKIFSNEEEMLEKAKEQLSAMRSVAQQAKKVKDGIEELNRMQRKFRSQSKKVLKSFQRGKISKMLLLAAEKSTGLDLNPANYIPKNLGADKFIKAWNVETKNEKDILQKLDKLTNSDRGFLRLFLTKYRGGLALKELGRIGCLLKAKEAKRDSLKQLLEKHKDSQEESYHRENYENNEKDISELNKDIAEMAKIVETSVQQTKNIEANDKAIKLLNKLESQVKHYFSGKNIFEDDE